MLHNIVSLVDFSKHSKISFHAAAKLAQKNSAKLHVLHVSEPVTAFASEGELLYEPHITVQELSKDLKKWVAAELKKAAPKVSLGKVEVVFGPILPTALEWSKKQRADLVTLGTHGHSGLAHLLLGSVTEKFVRHSNLPTLVVKNATTLPAKRVLVPVDLSNFSKEAIQLAERFCQKNQAQLEIAHVVSMGDVLRLKGFLKAEIDSKELFKAVEAHALQRITKLIGRKASNIKIHVLEGEVSETLNQIIKTRKIDLVILPTHGHTGLKHMLIGSTAERLVRTLKSNCFTFAPAKLKDAAHKIEL